MAIGSLPFYNRPMPGAVKARTLTANGGGTAAPYDIVTQDTTSSDANPDDVTQSTSAGQTLLCGVIIDAQGDPNNSGLFTGPYSVNVCEAGTVPVNLVAGTYAKGDTIIASGTAGAGKVLGAESKPYDVLGYFDDVPQTTSGKQPLSVRLNIHRVPA